MRAKNGRYTRSYVDSAVSLGDGGPGDQVESRRTFGFKYGSRADYKKYKKAYRRFCGSLVQYADGSGPND